MIEKDPEIFSQKLQSALDVTIQKKVQQKTDDWLARNQEQTISGSEFATCIRKAWYGFFNRDSSNSNKDPHTNILFWLGHQCEEQFLEILNNFDEENKPQKIHTNQQEPPVHQVYPSDNRFKCTTDFVLEYLSEKGNLFIPIELKSKGHMYNWNAFQYWEHELMQVCYWIHYAKLNNYNIPYGKLIYISRADYSIKEVTVSVDVPFHKLGRIVKNYDEIRPYLQERIDREIFYLDQKVLPPKPVNIRSFLCRSCPFQQACNLNSETLTVERRI